MQSDSIIKEVWEAKDALAASCDHNPEKLAAMLKNSPFSDGVKTVDYHGRKKKVQPETPGQQATFRVAEESPEYKTKKPDQTE